MCSPESCNGAVIPSYNVTGDPRNRWIDSTLLINTSMLQLSTTGGDYSATIRCIQHQIVPSTLNLQGRDNQTFSARLVVMGVPVVAPSGKCFILLGGDVNKTEPTLQ